ncbi:class I SAM-dependent methyltransferase [Paraferrimonas sp. SM1919]|uniref:class I SAM-dependent methyltransferase n=1 Tax=Paraferrimonas sp. SM1919 TaxID=2662263 RepID=UPI001F0983D7|nr:class I SAM-dependent methyltransferase [Paraferrimonas sp. SM1919]
MARALPSWRKLEAHPLLANVDHDQAARLNFLTHLNVHLSKTMVPSMKDAYEQQVKPFIEQPQTRHDIRKAMLNNGFFQMWSALRRNTMEMRHQLGRAIVLPQAKALAAKVQHYNQGQSSLQLDENIEQPINGAIVDIHCQPGGYHTEYFSDDVSVAASYDLGLFVTTAGLLGSLSDGGGQAIVNWLQSEHPKFQPKRILDLGCTIGHNVLPLAQAYPQAQVVAVDTARPSIRYAHARAKALGVENITFVQANAENLSQYADGSFDLITTSMFLHELSSSALANISKECYRLLAQGGLNLHLEQPQYAGMELFEQFMRDWDTLFNNEPFWGPMHDLELDQVFTKAGFDAGSVFSVGVVSKVDPAIFGSDANKGEAQDYGRAPIWNAYGLWKK